MPTATSLIVLLHGVGSMGADMGALEPALRGAVPHAAFAAPDAPHPFDRGPQGFQWFSTIGVNDGNRAGRIKGAREGFDRTLKDELERHGFTDRLDRVALIGFSQGAILSLDAIAEGRWPVGAVVAASGRLVLPPGPNAAVATPVLLLHGASDGVVAVEETPKAERALIAAGFKVEAKVYPGLGHSISAEGLEATKAFLARLLAA